MVDLIAASSLSQVPELIADCGGDADEVFGRLGVDREVVGAYDRFVPFTTVSTLVGTCARELGVPDFGLRLAARQHPDILGPLAIVARNAKTIGEALNKVAEFAHVYSPAITTTLVDDGRSVHNEFGTVPKRVPYRPHVMELALGVSLSTIRMLSDDQFHPTRVEVTHLPIAPEATYRAYFGCPVKFGAARDCMRFSSSLMRQRLRQIDPLAHDLALRFLMGRDRDTAFEDVVTALVVRSLPTGSARLESVARLLVMHPRAVQRTLTEAGTTFDQLVDDARRDLASEMLAGRGIPLSTVARQLGYAEQSVLTRSCRRWFGVTPLAKRRELTAGAGRRVPD